MPQGCGAPGPPAAKPRRLAGAALLAVALALLSPAPLAAMQVFTPAEAVNLPKAEKVTAFGSSYDDWVIQLYFLADRTNKVIDVVDTRDGPTQHTVIAQLAGTPAFAGDGDGNPAHTGPNGVVTVNERELWAGDYDAIRGTGVVKVFDLGTGKLTHVITTGGVGRAGKLCYDPNHDLVLVANDSEPLLGTDGAPFDTLISTTAYQIVGTILLNGATSHRPRATNGIGQCRWDEHSGDFFQVVPEVGGPGNDTLPGAIIKLSTRGLRAAGAFPVPIADCAGPQGMALGPRRQALLGCADPNGTVPTAAIMNLREHTVVKTIAGEDGADDVWFDPNAGDYALAISTGAAPGRLGVINAKFKNTQPSYATGRGTHSLAIDNIFDEVYMPIPSDGGSNLCSSVAISPGIDANGCIMVFTDPPMRRG